MSHFGRPVSPIIIRPEMVDPLKNRLILSRNVDHYQSTLRNIPEDLNSHLNYGGGQIAQNVSRRPRHEGEYRSAGVSPDTDSYTRH